MYFSNPAPDPLTPAVVAMSVRTDAPQTDAPKTDAPQTAAPQTAAPKTDAPKTAAPQTDAPKTDAPPAAAAIAPYTPNPYAPVAPDPTPSPGPQKCPLGEILRNGACASKRPAPRPTARKPTPRPPTPRPTTPRPPTPRPPTPRPPTPRLVPDKLPETPKQYVSAEVITDARPCLTQVDCETTQRRYGYGPADPHSNVPGNNPCTWSPLCATCRPGETLVDGSCCPTGNPDKIYIQQNNQCVKCPKGYKVRTGKLPHFAGARETAEVCELDSFFFSAVGYR